MRRKRKKNKEQHSLIWMITIGLFIVFPLKIIFLILGAIIDTIFPGLGRMLHASDDYEEDDEDDDNL